MTPGRATLLHSAELPRSLRPVHALASPAKPMVHAKCTAFFETTERVSLAHTPCWQSWGSNPRRTDTSPKSRTPAPARLPPLIWKVWPGPLHLCPCRWPPCLASDPRRSPPSLPQRPSGTAGSRAAANVSFAQRCAACMYVCMPYTTFGSSDWSGPLLEALTKAYHGSDIASLPLTMYASYNASLQRRLRSWGKYSANVRATSSAGQGANLPEPAWT